MATPTELNQLYLAYFNRPADVGALAFYASMPVSQVVINFSASPESKALYGNTFGAAQISQIYSNLFNRPAEPAGIAAWAALLANGTITPAALALTILQGAQNDDKTAVANKLSFTAAWTSTYEAQAEAAGLSPATAYALGKTLLASVGASPTSLANITAAVPGAIATLAGGGGVSAPPQTFTLTTAADTFTGGAGDDTFNGLAKYTLNGSTATEATGITFNSATDTLDGGAGTDTLALTVSTNGVGSGTPTITIDPARVTNIERLVLTPAARSTIVLAPTSSFTELVSNGTGGTTTFTGYGTKVTKLGVSGLASGAITFSAAGTALTGTSDAVTLTLTGVGSSTNSPSVTLTPTGGVATDFYETLNLVSAGTANYVALAAGTSQTSLATLNISGSAPLALGFGFADSLQAVRTIDASATTGGVTIGDSFNTLGSGGTLAQTVRLGSGDDTVFFGASLDATDTVDGGAGRDTLSVSSAVTAAQVTNVSNVEVLRYDLTAAALAQDVSLLGSTHGFTDIAINDTNGTTLTLSNMPATGLTAVNLLSDLNSTTSALTLSLAGSVTPNSSALTVRFASTATSGGQHLGTLSDIANLKTLNIVSGGSAGGNFITSDKVLAQQVLTGSVDLTLGTSGATGGIKLDASAFTGKLTLTASDFTNTVVLGSGNDTITMGGGAFTNTVTLGAQGSNAATGADIIRFQDAGSGVLKFVSNNAAGNGAATSYAGVADIADGSVATPTAVFSLSVAFSANDSDFSLRNFAGTAFTGLAKGSTAQGLTAGDVVAPNQQIASTDGAVAVASANVGVFALTTATGFTTDIKSTFAAAMGTASITGLAADANYLVYMYDNTNNKTVIAVVNTGANAAHDTTLSAADFTDSGVAVIGVVNSGSLNDFSRGAAF